jgi:uncharacterized protein (DUF4415 family)
VDTAHIADGRNDWEEDRRKAILIVPQFPLDPPSPVSLTRKNGGFTMDMIRETLTAGQKLTEAQIEEVRNAVKYPGVYTDDAPKLTPEELAEFRKVNAARRERVMCTLRISRNALDWWKSTGNGYTSAMARILDEARNYPELLKKCL